MLSEDVWVNGSDGLNGVQNILIIWRGDVYSHIFTCLESNWFFCGVKRLNKINNLAPGTQLYCELCRDPRVLFNPFLLAVATGLTHLQQFVLPLPGSSHLLCSHSYPVTWIFLIFIFLLNPAFLKQLVQQVLPPVGRGKIWAGSALHFVEFLTWAWGCRNQPGDEGISLRRQEWAWGWRSQPGKAGMSPMLGSKWNVSALKCIRCHHSSDFIVQLPDLGESEPLTAAEVYCSRHDQSVPLRAESSTELALMAVPVHTHWQEYSCAVLGPFSFIKFLRVIFQVNQMSYLPFPIHEGSCALKPTP